MKKIAPIPKEGVSDFQSNSYIETDMGDSKQGNNFTCDICGPKTPAVCRCLDCEENLCQYCCNCHEKMKATKTHKIRNMDEQDMKGKIRQRLFCSEHEEEEIKVYCLKCSVPICLVCKVINHEGHAAKTLAKVASDIKETLNTKLTQCTAKLEGLKRLHQEREEYMKEIDNVEQDEMQAVEKRSMYLIALITKDEDDMTAKIKSIYDKLREENTDCMLILKKDTDTYASMIDSVHGIIEQLSDIEIIEKNRELEEKASTIVGVDETTIKKGKLERKLFEPNKEKWPSLVHMVGDVGDSTEKRRMVNHIEENWGKEIIEAYPLESDITPLQGKVIIEAYPLESDITPLQHNIPVAPA